MHLWVLVMLTLPTMEFNALPDNEHAITFHTDKGCQYVQRQVERAIRQDPTIQPGTLRLACLPVEAAQEILMDFNPKPDPGEV